MTHQEPKRSVGYLRGSLAHSITHQSVNQVVVQGLCLSLSWSHVSEPVVATIVRSLQESMDTLQPGLKFCFLSEAQ